MTYLENEGKYNTDYVYIRYNVVKEGPAIKPENDIDVKKILPTTEPFRTLAMAVIAGDSEKAAAEAKKALERTPPLDVIEKGLAKGMDAVSALYAKSTFFLPDVMLSADAMAAAMVQADAKLGSSKEYKGNVVSFVAEGDPHDIGKNLVVMFLRANGFQVFDLGRDVPDAEVVATVKKNKPVMLTGTALMTTTMTAFPRVAEMLKKDGIAVPIFGCGGGAVKRDFIESFDTGVYGVKAFHAPKLAAAALEGKSWKDIRSTYPKVVGEAVGEYADRA
jgi:methanol corrinoid protein